MAMLGSCAAPLGYNLKLQLLPWLCGLLWLFTYPAWRWRVVVPLSLFLLSGALPLRGAEELEQYIYASAKIIGFCGLLLWMKTWNDNDISMSIYIILCIAILVLGIEIFIIQAAAQKHIFGIAFPRISGIAGGGVYSSFMYGLFAIVMYFLGKYVLSFAFICLMLTGVAATSILALGYVGLLIIFSYIATKYKKLMPYCKMLLLYIALLFIIYPFIALQYKNLPMQVQYNLMKYTQLRTFYHAVYTEYSILKSNSLLGIGYNINNNNALTNIFNDNHTEQYISKIENYAHNIPKSDTQQIFSFIKLIDEPGTLSSAIHTIREPHSLPIQIILYFGLAGYLYFAYFIFLIIKYTYKASIHSHVFISYMLIIFLVNDINFFIMFFSIGFICIFNRVTNYGYIGNYNV
jgi:hypothetical protein